MKHALHLLQQATFSSIKSDWGNASSHLFCETLESRLFLSGTVLASVAHGNLQIRGNSAANTIVLDQVGLTANQVRVTAADGTTINDQAGPVILSGITHSALIQMTKGANSVTLNNLSLPGDVSIIGNGGNETLTLNNVQIAANLTIQSDSNLAMTSTLTDITVGKNLLITRRSSAGQNFALQSVVVQRDTKIVGGSGTDLLTIDDSTFHGAAWIITGNANDVVEFDANGAPLGPPTLFDGPVSIWLGAGNDTLQLGVDGESGNQAIFASTVRIYGEKGSDTLLDFDASSYTGKSRFFVHNFESTTPVPDTTPPVVSSTSPANNAIGVALNNAVAATFSEAMDASTITAANITLTAASGASVLGTVVYVGTTATFTPSAQLAPNTLYTETISTGVENLADIPLAQNFVFSFTTGTTADTTAPTITSVNPANNATGVALNNKISATFSEAMDPTTITAANVIVTGPDTVPVLGTVAYVGTTMTFSPTVPLAANTLFTATITTGAKDLAGNALASNFVWIFTTGAVADTTAPTVTSTNPANLQTNVPINNTVAATFSEAIDPLTLTAATFKVTGPGGAAIAGAVNYDASSDTVTFTPSNNLTATTTYTMTITTGAKDLAGNPLTNNFVSTFTTGTVANTTAPTVTSVNPANLQINVSLNSTVAATFSEAMNPLTITSATFTVTGPGNTSVTGTLSYNAVTNTATFTPLTNLASDTTFTVTITTGAKDLAGNPLTNNFVSTFTTVDVAPTVTSTNPANLQTNVPINDTVAATFSEAMDPTTITTTTFTVTGPGNTPVTGTVTYDAPSDTATFTPSANLAPSTTFTAAINGAKDLAGTPLAASKVWTFTTGTQIAQAPINLGRAGAFAVMATASITGTGPTEINGDVGLNPGTAQGIPPAEVNGTIHIDDQTIINAQADLLAAYNDAVSRSVTSENLPGNMGGLTFTPGLYTNSTSVLIEGAGPDNDVTLDAQGDPNAIFIFKMGSTLTTGPGAEVILTGGAKASNVFWQVGTSATLNTTTIFYGNILASVTITVDTGSIVTGRLLAGSNSDGSVTIDASTVTLPTT
jgi:methionine-rich copper-binding protein CopC